MTETTPEDAPLDEPSKLKQIVVPLFGPVEEQFVRLANGATSVLRLGALDQDDCAAYSLTGDQVLVAGADYVRGPKFRLYEMGYLDNYDIGWYLAGANISDVAAMGAIPLGVLTVVRYPKDLADAEFGHILEGIRDCCAAVGARNVGGDIGSAERIILSASAFGVVEPSNLLLRTGGRPGQLVCLTGPTGLAGAAMRLAADRDLLEQMPGGSFEALLEKWRRVRPRTRHGRIFALHKGVTGCVDTSDGLKAALETLAHASGVGIEVDHELLPIHKGVMKAASLLGIDALELVFGDSVDFELVSTVDEGSLNDVAKACAKSGLDFHIIGRLHEGEGAWLRRSSESEGLPGMAWRHA